MKKRTINQNIRPMNRQKDIVHSIVTDKLQLVVALNSNYIQDLKLCTGKDEFKIWIAIQSNAYLQT